MTLSDPWPGFQGHGRQNWRFLAFKPPISQKRLKLRSCNFQHTVAPSLQFLHKLLRGSPERERQTRGWMKSAVFYLQAWISRKW